MSAAVVLTPQGPRPLPAPKQLPRVNTYGYEDILSDLDQAQRQTIALREGLEAVLSALEDLGLDNSHPHQLATQALKAAA
jgi:hypothetical protein